MLILKHARVYLGIGGLLGCIASFGFCSPKVVSYARFPDHTVLLTFDDGPAASTSTVLDTLQKEKIKALFFIVGENVTGSRKNLVQRTAAEGHMIGNHGYRHVNMTKLSAKEQVDALQKMNASVGDIQPILYFRPPGGACNSVLKRSVHTAGMRVMLWNVDPQDWKKDASQLRPDGKTLVKRVLEGLKKGGNRGIILLHDIHTNTARHLPLLIRALKEAGFNFLEPTQIADYQ